MNNNNGNTMMSSSSTRTSFVEMVRKYICCCKADRSTDYEILVTGGEQGDENIVTNSNGGPTYTGNSRPRLSESDTTNQTRSREEEEEEDLMNRIVDRTQQCIIYVTNLENSSLDFDLVQRSRLYSEAVKRHDAALERRRGLLLSDGSTDEDGAAQVSAPALLDNVGARATELLAQPVPYIDHNELSLLTNAADLFLEAYQLGAQIECKDELIVYELCDDSRMKTMETPDLTTNNIPTATITPDMVAD